MISKEAAHKKIASLIERFNEQNDFYKRSDYNETLTRRDFIDPFFKALGWDIDNEQGYAESYREVIHEDKIKIGGATKAPDYSFRLGGGKRLFFVEAKKPSVLIKDEITPAYQVRRYGWSAKLPISIITDFEEFAIYDCTKKPNLTDKASHGRIKYLTYQHYLNEFDFIWDTFSKEKVLKGSFDKFVQSDKQKKGTSTVDHEFLTSLDTWRTYLANNIALRNNINEDELNFAVQHIIDRLIFLRIAEDRSVESYGNLQETVKSGNYYENLLKQFHTADQKYNSGLFDFSKDKISGNIEIDNKIVKNIISDLYYPVSPYEFSVISVEILGSAYEQFLGKTISLSKSGRAVIEEKPEVRKAGGVYYTPQYIVEYIVKNTVGKLIEGKAPKDINKVKIVDPACGSGGFLIGAYQCLLQYHKDFYTNNGKPSKGSKDNPLTPDGHLTTAEKKRILLNNIFGVDLDANAVEVTKLSLLLKCMEGETEASISTQLKLFHERVLPTLDNNIKYGNSLIDIDFYSSEIDFGEEKKIKPFNWNKAFLEVFKQGGFDCVIGNPPWGAELQEKERNYLIDKFPLVPTKTKDSYFYFLFKSFQFSKPNSFIGLVLPNSWLLINNAKEVRKFLLSKHLLEIIDYGDNVFKDAIVETSTLVLKNEDLINGKCSVKRYKKNTLAISQDINLELWRSDPLYRFNIDNDDIFNDIIQKVSLTSVPFNIDCEIIFGIKPYQLGHGKPPQTREVIDNRVYHANRQIDTSWKPLLTGTDINRYYLNDPGNVFIKYGEWLMYKSNESKMLSPKIFLRRTSDTIRACYDDKNYYGQNSLFIINSKTIDLKFLLGILNSKLQNYIYKKKCPQTGKIFAEVKPSIIKELPIVQIKNVNQETLQKEMIKQVDLLLKLNKEKNTVTFQNKNDQIQNRIDYCEQRTNEIVYELYGLTKDEIALIESV